MPTKSLKYCPYYCEENIWQLCDHADMDNTQWLAIIISNRARQVALWQQRAAAHPDIPIIWDYHVIAAQLHSKGWQIWDLDSHCRLPAPALDYLQKTFHPVPTIFQPLFRVMSGSDYRSTLASDRRHMRDSRGTFLQPPPDWPIIGSGHNLQQLVDMQQPAGGEILDLDTLTRRLGKADEAS